MIDLYISTSYRISKLVTRAYSTSFSWGIRAFSPEYRNAIYAIYGYVRIADEIVDSFHQHDKKSLLKKFRQDTREAIDEGISTNPVLSSFQETVRDYNIDWNLIEKFLDSMEMDLYQSSYDRNVYDEYIFGSAEAVGLMCLKVFVNGDEKRYNELKHSARMLGSAFQKVNFLRDIKSDIDERGRIYLPDAHEYSAINDYNKKKLEDEVEIEFEQALEGIKKLPMGVKLGVYSAYLYYRVLFNKIKRLSVSQLLKNRVRISNPKKLLLLLKSLIEIKVLKLT